MEHEDDQDIPQFDAVLESPPTPETPLFGLDPVPSFLAADQAGVAVLNAKLVVVESFLNLLPRDINFSDFSREMLLLIMKVVKSEAGSILELDYTNDEFFFRTGIGQSSGIIHTFRVPKSQGIVGHVAESQVPLVVNNAEENQIHLKAVARAVGFEARNLVAVPIVIRGRTYGVLELLNRVGDENYGSDDLEILVYFCEMAAKLLEVRFMLSWSRQARANPRKESA